MASHGPMDAEMKEEACIAACFAWTEVHPQEVQEIGFEVLEAEESSLTFRAEEKLFQLILPSQLFQGGCGEGENFVAMNLDNSAEDSLMTVLNEKLERVRVHPLALSEVFDLFVQVLTGRRSKQGSRGSGRAGQVGVGAHGQVIGKGDDDSGSDVESEGQLQSDDDGGLQESDDVEYDTVFREDFECSFLQSGSGGSRKRPVERPRGYVYFLAEAARERCEAARRNHSPSLHLGLEQAAVSSPWVDDIVKYCLVSPVPQLGMVKLHLELPALINDLKIARALGLSFEMPLDVLLEFDKYFWEVRCSKPLEVARVLARQEKPAKARSGGAEADKKLGSKADDFDALYRKCFGNLENAQAYGMSVLIPELVRVFFTYRARRVHSGLRSLVWKNKQLDFQLEQCVTMENPFTGLLCFVGGQMRELPSWCAICWSALPSTICRLRTCPNELCLYEFEELGLGSAILHEVQESAEVVDLELTLACAAAATLRDVFEPFPGFLLENDEVRGRSGWFSSAVIPKKDCQINAVATSKKKSTAAQGVQNKNLKVLVSTLQTIPSVEQLKQCEDEKSLKKTLAMAGYMGREMTSRELSLSYDLFRFILSTNRLSLRFLDRPMRIPGLEVSKYQFAILHDSPEREAEFEKRRGEKGSFFAFHGSGMMNWYSILRNGLRSMSSTHYQSSGAAHGQGIYLANNLSMSYAYSGSCGGDSRWKNSMVEGGCNIVAICEVVEGSSNQARNTTGIYVVPPDKQDNVIIRYLLVCPGTHLFTEAVITDTVLRPQSSRHHPLGYVAGKTNSTASVDALAGNLGLGQNSFDLLQHFENLKLEHKAEHESQLQFQRTTALGRLEELERMKGNKSTDVKCQSQYLPVAGIGGQGSDSRTVNFSKLTTGDGFSYDLGHERKRWKNERASASAAPIATAAATQAITKEYRRIHNEMSKAKAGVNNTDSFLANITVDLPDETNLYTWHVCLFHNLFKSSPLYKDLVDWATERRKETPHILLEVTFSGRFPFQPPFVRVVYPRFEFHTGHITIGGSICMELLTESGWSPAFSFESVLVQIVNAVIEGKGRIDKRKGGQEYSEREAQEAFNRVAAQHGWKVGQRS